MTTKSLFLLACFVCSAALYGQSRRSEDAAPAVIELKFKDTPNIRFTNEPNIERGDNKWLVIEVSFTPRESRISKDHVEWMDGLIVQYDILLPSIHRGRNVFAMLSGEVQYWAIPMDGKKHILEGFVPPQILERYIRPGLKLNRRALESTIAARVSFYTPGRRMLGQYYSNLKGETEAQLAQAFERASDSVEGGVINVPDAVYSRDQTPWYYVNFGSYNLIKKRDK